MGTPAWISLGSNLGDRRAILDEAVDALTREPGVKVRAISSYHETKPVGGPPGQGPFLNAAAHLETSLDPFELLRALQRLEHQAGRVRTVRWGERTLDLDILIYGTENLAEILDTKDLELPHPRLALRRFVLGPLAEIAPVLVEPKTGKIIEELLENLDRTPRLVAIDGPGGPLKSTIFRRVADELGGFKISVAEPPELERDLAPFEDWIGLLERKAEALRGGYRVGKARRVPWIVVDFHFSFDESRAAPKGWWRSNPTDQAQALFDARHEIGLRIVGQEPTFVVILPGDSELRRRPVRRNVPELRPMSDDPDAIVAEVVATCRGIEGV